MRYKNRCEKETEKKRANKIKFFMKVRKRAKRERNSNTYGNQ